MFVCHYLYSLHWPIFLSCLSCTPFITFSYLSVVPFPFSLYIYYLHSFVYVLYLVSPKYSLYLMPSFKYLSALSFLYIISFIYLWKCLVSPIRSSYAVQAVSCIVCIFVYLSSWTALLLNCVLTPACALRRGMLTQERFQHFTSHSTAPCWNFISKT